MKNIKKHFADLEPGDKFVKNGKIYEKITPVFTNHTPPRLKANYKDVATGRLVRSRGIAMVELVDE